MMPVSGHDVLWYRDKVTEEGWLFRGGRVVMCACPLSVDATFLI